MLSLLLVNYRSATLAADAVRTAREATRQDLEIIILDNSCDPAEVERLRAFHDTVLVAPRNLGYGAGANLARRSAHGEVLIVANPDVRFEAGALDALSSALTGRTAVAGPALFWDESLQWRLPPGDLSTGWERMDVILAGRSQAWFRERDRRRIRQRIAFWSLQAPTPVPTLSGAVLAMRADVFDAVGGFDERFALYFEETDLLRRVRERHHEIVYVPQARCRHLFNQSAGQDASLSAARYAESELRYLEKWNGPWAARTIKRLERPLPAFGDLAPQRRSDSPVVIEASPLASFATAAGRFSDRMEALALPSDVLATLRGVPIHVRCIDRNTGEVLATGRIHP